MRKALVAALGALLLIPAQVFAGAPLPPELAQDDPDGGQTLRLLIDDGQGGVYTYIAANVTNTKNLAAGLLGQFPQTAPVGQALRDLQEPITEAGVFTHSWTHEGAPMLTLGAYAIHREWGMMRLPLALLENVATLQDVAPLLTQFLLNDVADMVTPALAFALEAALVSAQQQFDQWPGDGSTDTYQTYPTVYAWYLRKVEAGHEAWNGFYLLRTGHREGQSSGTGHFAAEKRVEIGTAIRLDGQEQHVAGVYLRSQLAKEGDAQGQQSGYDLTAGVHTDAAGDVPLTSVRAEDERYDAQGDAYGTPEEQRTRVTIGAWAAGSFVPLLATETVAQHRKFACPPQPADQPGALVGCIEQHRLTSVGTFVGDAYTPVLGVRYHGERLPVEAWATAFLAGGGPGAQNVGDFEVDAGTFVNGGFVPLVGATYDDSFPEARRTYQMMLTAGLHTPLGYQPILGATYDGGLPIGPTVSGLLNDDPNLQRPWLTSAGVFAKERYVPVLGVRYQPSADGGEHDQQHQLAVGTFLAQYHLFVPLAGAQWDGDRGPVSWALAAAQGGLLGSDTGDWDLTGGLFLLGAYEPLFRVQWRDHYESPAGDFEAQTMVIIGAENRVTGFVPLLGITYSGDQAMVPSLGDPGTFEDDTAFLLTVGAFVQDKFTPLLGVRHSSEGLQPTVLPGVY